VHLTLAINDYDLVSGKVGVEGVDLTCLRFEVEEIFFRFTHHREWHVSELSLTKFSPGIETNGHINYTCMAMSGRSIAPEGALHMATPRTRAELLAEVVEADIGEQGLRPGTGRSPRPAPTTCSRRSTSASCTSSRRRRRRC
jgi:hypothetical protein